MTGVASITDRRITSDLAIRTLQKALESQPTLKGELILHSDQGTQYTSKAFIDYCESAHVTQSMSKAGDPYDNAPMERYFNMLKNECTNLYEFKMEKWDAYEKRGKEIISEHPLIYLKHHAIGMGAELFYPSAIDTIRSVSSSFALGFVDIEEVVKGTLP